MKETIKLAYTLAIEKNQNEKV